MTPIYKLISVAVALPLTLLNLGCAGNPPIADDFGRSVAAMQDSQVYDRTTLTEPNRDPPTGQDGVMAVGKLEGVYRESQSARTGKQTLKSGVFDRR